MEAFKSLFAKPDPQAQVRKCNALLRQNIRRIDRDILNARTVETKTKNLILAADKRATRLGPNHQQTKQAQREIREFARELVKRRKETNRLHTFKAQLTSVQMQVNEAFALRKIEGSIKASVGIMKDVNTLIRLPELAGTMQELSVELMKAGIMEEMVGDALPETEVYEEEEEEAEEEVEKILGEILKDRMDKTGVLPSAPLPQKQPAQKQPQQGAEEGENEEEDTEAMMNQMRNRLEALRS